MKLGLISINRDGIIGSVDKNYAELFGWEESELLGQPLTKTIPSPYKEQHDRYIQNYLKSGVRKIIGTNRVVEGQNKEGEIFPLSLSVSKVGEGDDIVFIGKLVRWLVASDFH